MNYSYKTHYASLPGNCNIAYVDEGRGDKTLLFIHGLGNYAMVWSRNIDYLRQYYRCIAIDLPGNGLSDKNEHPYDLHFFADCVRNFIDVLRLENVVLIGHSMGGQIAMLLAAKYDVVVEKLVLCAPAGFEEFSQFDKQLFYNTIHLRDYLSSEESLLRQTIESSFYTHHSQAEGVVRELLDIMKTYPSGYYKKMIEACIKGMLENTVTDVLHEIRLPTLVIFGQKDALIPNKLLHHTTTEHIAREGTKKITGARLELLNNCGHFVQWEKADEVNRLIMLFAEEQATRLA